MSRIGGISARAMGALMLSAGGFLGAAAPFRVESFLRIVSACGGSGTRMVSRPAGAGVRARAVSTRNGMVSRRARVVSRLAAEVSLVTGTCA
jgi:hypothetical protein